MFKLVPNPVFPAVVKLSVPGSPTAVPITFNFKHQGRKALRAWVEAATGRPHVDVLADVVDSWAGVQNPDGAPVPYTVENLGLLLDAYPASGEEIFDGYLDALLKGREKN